MPEERGHLVCTSKFLQGSQCKEFGLRQKDNEGHTLQSLRKNITPHLDSVTLESLLVQLLRRYFWGSDLEISYNLSLELFITFKVSIIFIILQYINTVSIILKIGGGTTT